MGTLACLEPIEFLSSSIRHKVYVFGMRSQWQATVVNVGEAKHTSFPGTFSNTDMSWTPVLIPTVMKTNRVQHPLALLKPILRIRQLWTSLSLLKLWAIRT